MNLALFDFDGTITTRDTFLEFIRFALAPSRLLVGKALLTPWILGYRLGLISAPRIRPVISRVAFSGMREQALRSLGEAFAKEQLPLWIRRETRQRLDWHREQGDQIVVVSASLDVYLSAWCREQGFDVLCTNLEAKGGRITGRYRDGDCSGSVKKGRVLSKYDLTRYGTVFAYGDTIEDRELLELAERRFFRGREIAHTSEMNPAISW